MQDTSESLGKSLTTLSWLTTVNVDELRRKHEKEDKVDNFGNKKPTHSYADLIRMAITSTDSKRMTLSEIYEYVECQFPYYKSAGGGWKNSIRHNLSLNVAFEKLPRPRDEPGKGSYWIINPNPPKPDNFRPRNSNRKRPAEKIETDSLVPAKKPSKQDIENINYRDIYENIFKPHEHYGQRTPLPSVNSFVQTPSTVQSTNCVMPSTPSPLSSENSHHIEAYSPQSGYDGRTSVHSDDSRNAVMNYHMAQSVTPSGGQNLAKCSNFNNQSIKHQLPHPLQRNPTQSSTVLPEVQKKNQLCRQPSGSTDPMQWSIENLKLPESSMRDNPEFQEILNQLKMAESQNWQLDKETKTNLAISLSQFMFKNQNNEQQIKNSGIKSDDEDNYGLEDPNGCEIDYFKLAQL